MASGGHNRRWRRGGTPSWYDGSWTQEGITKKEKSLARYKEREQSQKSEAASASTEGARDGTAQEARDKVVKRVKAAGKVQTENHVALKEHIGACSEIAATCFCTHSPADESCPIRVNVVECENVEFVRFCFFTEADVGPPRSSCQIEFVLYRSHGDLKKGVQQCSLDQ